MIKSFILKIKNKFLRKKVYVSYGEALSDFWNRGYEDEDLAKVVYLKTKTYKENLLSGSDIGTKVTEVMGILASVIKSIGSDVSVLDFGGACGETYFTIKKFLGQKHKLNWVVVETKMMCKYGRKLENEELKFFDDIQTAKMHMPSADVINISGSLQYVDEPYKFINYFLEYNSKFVLFSRMCFTSNSRDIVTIQRSMLSWHGNGKLLPGLKNKEIRCPFTAIQKSQFDDLVQQKYEYQKTFMDDSGIIRINNEPIFGLGLLCKRKS